MRYESWSISWDISRRKLILKFSLRPFLSHRSHHPESKSIFYFNSRLPSPSHASQPNAKMTHCVTMGLFLICPKNVLWIEIGYLALAEIYKFVQSVSNIGRRGNWCEESQNLDNNKSETKMDSRKKYHTLPRTSKDKKSSQASQGTEGRCNMPICAKCILSCQGTKTLWS